MSKSLRNISLPRLDPKRYGETPSPAKVIGNVTTPDVQVTDESHLGQTKTLNKTAALEIFETADAFDRAWNGEKNADGKVVRAPNIDAVMALTTPNFKLNLFVPPLVPGTPTKLDRNAAKATWKTELPYAHGLAIDQVAFLSKDTAEVKETIRISAPGAQAPIEVNGVIHYRRVAAPKPGRLSWLISEINVYPKAPATTPAAPNTVTPAK